jgi:YesN/AraC family two-component response regulator
MMPVMDGNELTRQIRENQQLAAIPVLMLTAKRDDDDRAEAYRIGADAYITKPFNSAVLLARIQNLIDHKLKADEKLAEQLFAGIKDVKVSHADEDFLKACVACVQRHLADADFSLPAFAEEMNMSTSALYKRLRATTGLTTSAFIRTLRMKSAQRLLQQNPHARISDVAYAVGYTDPKYFSSCFKKDFGVLPSEFLSTQNREE